MIVWRICKKDHEENTLRGVGGLFVSGRWHSKGSLIVYTSESLALAAWETFIHMQKPLPRTLPFVQLEIELPERLLIEEISYTNSLFDSLEKTQAIGDEWLKNGSACVLKVPSKMFPQECNYLLNPQHKHFHRIRCSKIEPFTFDGRL